MSQKLKPSRWLSIPGAFVLTLLCACSTISLKQTLSYPLPPSSAQDTWGRDPITADASLEKQRLADDDNDPLRILVRYQQAKLWAKSAPEKSCALWNEVLDEKRFPLLNVATLRAMEVCPLKSRDFPPIDEVLRENSQAWLSELAVRASLKRAQKTGDANAEAKLSLRLAGIERLQSDRIDLAQAAFKIAEKTKNEGLKKEAVSKLETIAPRFIKDPQASQLLSVAYDFRQAREFEKAREWYNRVLSSELPANEKLRALDGIRMSFKLEKNTDRYIAGTKSYSDFAEENFLNPGIAMMKADRRSKEGSGLIAKYLDTRMTLARAVWTEGESKAAERILLKAERQVRRYVSIDESVFLRARIEEEAGHFQSTVQILNTIDVNKNPSRDFRTKVLWYRAWNERKIGKLKEAAAALLALIEIEEAPTQVARDRFWLGKIYKELNQSKEANEQFQKLIDEDTVGWYGLLSYRELGKMIPPLAKTSEKVEEKSDESSQTALIPEERLTFEWLIAAGETDLAKKFLDDVTDSRRSTLTDSQTLDLLKAYAKAGQYLSLFSRLYELPVPQRKRLLETHTELLFPQPWPTLVQTASSRFDVQAELVYSIMRQESSFNPLARSPADAFGLMQLIPEMAKKASASSGVSIGDHEDLYLPELNIPLGTAFVRSLQDYWKGEFIPTVASYNASEKAIAGWVKTRYRGDTLTFIEDVPYEETRNYLKLVMRNFIFYKRLNSGGSPIPFPEWCLAPLQRENP